VEPSIEALLAGPSAGDAVVPIEALCYRGPGALQRAAALRGEITAALDRGSDLTAIRPLLQELLDLVPLALAPA
jgi:hypothetical protein